MIPSLSLLGEPDLDMRDCVEAETDLDLGEEKRFREVFIFFSKSRINHLSFSTLEIIFIIIKVKIIEGQKSKTYWNRKCWNSARLIEHLQQNFQKWFRNIYIISGTTAITERKRHHSPTYFKKIKFWQIVWHLRAFHFSWFGSIASMSCPHLIIIQNNFLLVQRWKRDTFSYLFMVK